MGRSKNRLVLFEEDGRALRARRGDVGSDAVARRPGLPARRARRAARVLGAERRSPRRACCTRSPCALGGAGHVSDGRGRRRQRARTGSPPRSRWPRPGRVGDGARGAGARRRRGRDRGADAAGLPARHVLVGLPGGRRLARVRALAARAPRAALGPSALLLRAPAARTGARRCWRATSTRRPRSLDALHAGRRRRLAGLRGALPRALRRAGARRCCPGFPPLPGPLKLLAALGSSGMLEWARLLLMPAHALAHELFGARRRARLAVRRGDARRRAADGAGSAIAAAHLNLMGHAVGLAEPGGRRRPAGRRARAATSRRSAGVTRTGARGDAGRGRARPRRRRRARGRRARAGASIVIADVTPHAPARARGRRARRPATRSALRRYRYGPATLKVDWALSGPVPWTAPEAREAGTVHVGGAEAGRPRGRSRRRAAGLAERPFLLFGQQSIADPTRAPGRAAHRLGLHARPAGGRLGARDRAPRRARRGADRALRARLPRPHPRPPRAVAGRPAAAQRRTSSAATSAPAPTRSTRSIFRPAAAPRRRTGRRSRGLYLGSAATFPGGAVHGVPGPRRRARRAARAARAALSVFAPRPPGYGRGSAVRAAQRLRGRNACLERLRGRAWPCSCRQRQRSPAPRRRWPRRRLPARRATSTPGRPPTSTASRLPASSPATPT